MPKAASDEQALRDLVAEWAAATAAGKPARLKPLLAEDVVRDVNMLVALDDD